MFSGSVKIAETAVLLCDLLAAMNYKDEKTPTKTVDVDEEGYDSTTLLQWRHSVFSAVRLQGDGDIPKQK